ncbi:Pycsar system effector family protein [Lysinibacillus sphaericus]
MMNNTNNLQTAERDHLCAQLDRHLDWIKSCDTKSSIVLAVVGIFLTLFTAEHSIKMLMKIMILTFENINFSNIIFLILCLIGLSFFVNGTYNLIRVLTPRLSKEVNLNEEVNVTRSLYFFESISRNKFSEFKERVISQSIEDEIYDLLTQIYVNARISSIKYKHYNKGIRYVFIGIALMLFLFFAGIILVKVGGM